MDLNNKFIIVKSHKEQVSVELILNAIGIYHTSGMFGVDISENELNYYSVSCIQILENAYWYYDSITPEYRKSLSMPYEEFIGLNL